MLPDLRFVAQVVPNKHPGVQIRDELQIFLSRPRVIVPRQPPDIRPKENFVSRPGLDKTKVVSPPHGPLMHQVCVRTNFGRERTVELGQSDRLHAAFLSRLWAMFGTEAGHRVCMREHRAGLATWPKHVPRFTRDCRDPGSPDVFFATAYSGSTTSGAAETRIRLMP